VANPPAKDGNPAASPTPRPEPAASEALAASPGSQEAARIAQKARVLQGQVLQDTLSELCDRKQSFVLTTPYHSFDSRFIELSGRDVLVRATMSQAVVQGVLNHYPLYMRFPWDLTTYGGQTRVLGYESDEKARNLRILMPASVAIDSSRSSYRVERVGRCTGAVSSPELTLIRVTLDNISTGGLRVFCLEPLPPGAFQYGRVVDVSVSLENGPQIKAPARICHADGQSMGLCFAPPLAGAALESLAQWILPRMEEDQRRWDNRLALRALSERNAQAKAAPAGVLLVSSDCPARAAVASALAAIQPLTTVPPALAALKDALSFTPPHLLVIVASGQADDTHRLRVMLDAVAPACPIVVVAAGADPERARTLAVEIKAARFVDARLLHPVIFLRLVQGLIRKHWDIGS
jgi:hypothetical protein